MNFLEAAKTDAEFRTEIPAFVADLKTIFETWQLTEYFGMSTVNSANTSARMSFAVLLPISLVERAREWLLREGD